MRGGKSLSIRGRRARKARRLRTEFGRYTRFSSVANNCLRMMVTGVEREGEKEREQRARARGSGCGHRNSGVFASDTGGAAAALYSFEGVVRPSEGSSFTASSFLNDFTNDTRRLCDIAKRSRNFRMLFFNPLLCLFSSFSFRFSCCLFYAFSYYRTTFSKLKRNVE